MVALCWIPKLEEVAAEKLDSATTKLFKRFLCFHRRRRYCKFHLHRNDRRHGEIAAVKSLSDQSQSIRFRSDTDGKPVESR